MEAYERISQVSIPRALCVFEKKKTPWTLKMLNEQRTAQTNAVCCVWNHRTSILRNKLILCFYNCWVPCLVDLFTMTLCCIILQGDFSLKNCANFPAILFSPVFKFISNPFLSFPDSYVAVYLPDQFLHLINTRHSELMCYHLFLAGKCLIADTTSNIMLRCLLRTGIDGIGLAVVRLLWALLTQKFLVCLCRFFGFKLRV